MKGQFLSKGVMITKNAEMEEGHLKIFSRTTVPE
jgi:hypothetical protein